MKANQDLRVTFAISFIGIYVPMQRDTVMHVANVVIHSLLVTVADSTSRITGE